MIRTFTFALTATVAFTTTAPAQYYHPSSAPGDPQTMVNSWYQRYLHRPADAGAAGWVQSLRTGHSPEEILSSILSSQEYYQDAGGSRAAYIQRLFTDLVGRPPAGPEITYWAGRMRFDSRKDVAYQLLIRHPQDWSINAGEAPAAPARPRSYYYDPGYYPLDPASLNFRDPGGPYFKSPYLPNYEYRRPIRAFPTRARG